MTFDRLEVQLSHARRDYERAVRALFECDSESARKRHARRAQTAARRVADARRELARYGYRENVARAA